MKKNSEKKKMNFLLKSFIYIVVLLLIFVVTILGTKYYFYDSDRAIKKTDLSAVGVDGIKLGQNINDIDLTKYTATENVVDNCNYNFEELSIKTDSKGVIEYINANYRKVKLDVGQEENAEIDRVNKIWDILGSNYENTMYKEKENNYWKISKYIDTENDIYLGLVYSRFNNEMLNVILSSKKIKD